MCVCVDGRERDDGGVRQRSEFVRHSGGLRLREVQYRLSARLISAGSRPPRCTAAVISP